MTPLIKACQKNYINIVSMLLEKGADCNLQLESTGISPFTFHLHFLKEILLFMK